MRYILLSLVISLTLFASAKIKTEVLYSAQEVPKKMSVTTKKERFFYLLVPAVEKVHNELMTQYKEIKISMQNNQNRNKIDALKKVYKVDSDEKLLLALKPHPQSIVLAQAAMESAWATSRFFVKANNVFGMWSANKNEPRIAAGEKRGGTKTIWLRKFSSVEDSVREYYKMMGRGRAYINFRDYRFESNDVFKIINGLDKYSEIGDKYINELASMIRYNKLTKYD